MKKQRKVCPYEKNNPDNAKYANAPEVCRCLQSFCTRVGWQSHIGCCRSLKVAASILVPRWGNAKTEEHKDYVPSGLGEQSLRLRSKVYGIHYDSRFVLIRHAAAQKQSTAGRVDLR